MENIWILLVCLFLIGFIILYIYNKSKYQMTSEILDDNLRDNLEPCIWLFGDSILDNSYWNNVEINNTGKLLQTFFGVDRIKDRSTEELTASLFASQLNTKNPIATVRKTYVDHRQNINYPYTGIVLENGDINVSLSGSQIKSNDIIILSIGGNDVVLLNQINPQIILNNIVKIIKYYTQYVSPKNIIYIIPYPPTDQLRNHVKSLGIDINALYTKMVQALLMMIQTTGIDYISLQDFTDNDRGNINGIIPEPTESGAQKIAFLISDKIRLSN